MYQYLCPLPVVDAGHISAGDAWASSETIYGHMNAAHGGIHDKGVVPEHVNYEEQELVLRQAREARQRAPAHALVQIPPLPQPRRPQRVAGDLTDIRAQIRRANEAGAQRMAARVAQA